MLRWFLSSHRQKALRGCNLRYMFNGTNGRLNGHSAPRIALPAPTSTDEGYNQRAWAPYFHSLTSAGAVGVAIPLNESVETVKKLAANCTGILLPGSPADVDPARYGEAAIPECGRPDPAREAVDALLLEDAFAKKKPVLGICYGLQSLNVWMGGSLIQHVRGPVNHDPGSAVLEAHRVVSERFSRLGELIARIEDGPETAANSSHHQTVRNPAKGLAISARCIEDNGIEALESTDPGRFVVGVQWHPERTYDTSAVSREIFRSFVAAAAAFAAQRELLAK